LEQGNDVSKEASYCPGISTEPEVVECDKVTGDDCFVARLFVRSMEHLDEVVDRIAEEATTHTSIVKGQLIRRRAPPIAT